MNNYNTCRNCCWWVKLPANSNVKSKYDNCGICKFQSPTADTSIRSNKLKIDCGSDLGWACWPVTHDDDNCGAFTEQ